MFKQSILLIALALSACATTLDAPPDCNVWHADNGHVVCDPDPCQPVSLGEAKSLAKQCRTNYGETVKYGNGYIAYCVPNPIGESCIDESSLVDCSGLGSTDCDRAMEQSFDACIRKQALTTCEE